MGIVLSGAAEGYRMSLRQLAIGGGCCRDSKVIKGNGTDGTCGKGADMKVLLGIGFVLAAFSLVLAVAGEDRMLVPASIFWGSSVIAAAVCQRRGGKDA